MNAAPNLDPATLQALAWTFGFLLFFVFATAIGFLISLLQKLSTKSIEHEVRISHVEDNMERANEALFPAKFDIKRKKNDN